MANKTIDKNKISKESENSRTTSGRGVDSTSLLEIWHPFSGKLVHIVQRTFLEKLIRKYYTDGKLVDVRKISKNGGILSDSLIGNKEFEE